MGGRAYVGEMHEPFGVAPRTLWEPAAASRRQMTMTSCKLIAAAVGLLLMAGCGAPSSDGASSAPTASADPLAVPPATRLIVPTTVLTNGATVTAIDAEDVDEPCPTSAPINADVSEQSQIMDETSRLEPMLGVVLQYGSERPDEFGGYGLHWFGVGDASVFVSFTGDVAQHRAALAEQVEFPDELIVCQAAASETDRAAIQATLVEELSGRFTSIGSGGKSGSVSVGLNPTEESLAAELVDRYGAAVDVSVGALNFPLDQAEAVCPPVLGASLIDGLEVSILADSPHPVIDQAGSVAVSVRLANTSDRPISFGSGQPTAVVTDSQGSPRTVDTRGVADVGIGIDIEPGGHQDFDLDVSLASCDPANGYLLAPGEHFLVVSFYNSELQADMNSEPLTITIAN